MIFLFKEMLGQENNVIKTNGASKKILNISKSHKNSHNPAQLHQLEHHNNQQQQQSRTGICDFNEENEDHSSLFDFSSKEEFKLGEQFYEQRLRKLNEQLTELKEINKLQCIFALTVH